ncbi:MAG: type II toxin-antitoxin system antitoxin SocA domain-containing protein [Arcobacter sp.]|uniref:type II toxin-antitoxin system antitoxin SocA domain-containing protein n=1 Tax=Arcobacter sp. TaxID=1872629 RepID=UPI003AFFE54B
MDMTKVANVILYMLHKQVKLLNDKKLSILLFLMDYNHLKYCGKKIFGDEYIKGARSPEPKLLSELFDVIISEEILEDDDERVFFIQEILDNVDIDIVERENFTEIKFVEIGIEYDEDLFDEDELKTINKLVNQYKEATPRVIANDTFKIDEYRAKEKGEVII